MTVDACKGRLRSPGRSRPLGAGAVCLGLMTILAAGLVACGPSGEEAGGGPPVSEEEATEGAGATAETSRVGASEPGSWVDDFSVGHAVDPQGAVPAKSVRREFAAGDVVYVSMGVGEAPAAAAVHVTFRDPTGEKVAEDEKKVPAGARYLYFDSGDTRHWEPGEYRVEIAAGGEVLHEQELTLTAGSSESR